TSSARLYWESFRAIFAAIASGQKPPELSLPVAFTVFPGEIFQAPRSWAEKVYPNLVYFNEADRGGHFAAWEEPELFAEEMRAGFRSLRRGGSSWAAPRRPPPRFAPSTSTFQLTHWETSVDASQRRVGPTGRRMPRKACSWRRY